MVTSCLPRQALKHQPIYLSVFPLHLRLAVMEESFHACSLKTVGREQERDLDPHNFVDKYGVILRPRGEENVHKIVDVE
jgi:hypothetical protein